MTAKPLPGCKIRFEVTFHCVPNCDLVCKYEVTDPTFDVHSRDWIALCAEKNCSKAAEAFYTWQWADFGKKTLKTVLFPAKHLPGDLESYIFVYIDYTSAIIAVSEPFKFALPSDDSLGEKITMVPEDSMIVVVKNSTSELETDENVLELKEKEASEESVSLIHQLKVRISRLEMENEQLTDELSYARQFSEKQEKLCRDLKNQVEVAKAQQLETGMRTVQLSNSDDAINDSQDSVIQLKAEIDNLKKQLGEKDTQLNLALGDIKSLEKIVKELKTKKRRLEKALVTERLTYEKNLQEARRSVTVKPKLGHSAGGLRDSEEEDSFGTIFSAPSSVSLQYHSAAVDEKEQTVCPVCKCPESRFGSNSDFLSHVDSHFDN